MSVLKMVLVLMCKIIQVFLEVNISMFDDVRECIFFEGMYIYYVFEKDVLSVCFFENEVNELSEIIIG